MPCHFLAGIKKLWGSMPRTPSRPDRLNTVSRVPDALLAQLVLGLLIMCSGAGLFHAKSIYDFMPAFNYLSI